MDRERDVEKYLRERVKAAGGTAYKFVSPGNDGVPDRVCVFPGGRICFVELKAEGGGLTPLQRRQIHRLKELGCAVFVARGKGMVDEFIERMEAGSL